MTNWLLVDCREPISSEEDLPKMAIESEAELRKALNEFQQRRPSIVELHSPSGEMLIIGIGGKFAGIRWMRPPLIEHFKTAVNGQPLTMESVDFRQQGTDTGFRPSHLFLPAQVVEEVVYFFKNGELSNRMQWLSIGRENSGR